MQTEIFTYSTIIVLAIFHTAVGPDHYLPFIVMSRARDWSIRKTAGLTFVCGLGHILSSVFIGLAGLAFGIVLHKLEAIQDYRSSVAAWLLILFGAAYILWGFLIRKGLFHKHSHAAENGEDSESQEHMDGKKSLTPWILFTIFVFGPCEVLIPMFLYYASINEIGRLVWSTLLFGIATIATMLTIVILALKGMKFIQIPFLERHRHTLAGLVIMLCGIAIQFLGL